MMRFLARPIGWPLAAAMLAATASGASAPVLAQSVAAPVLQVNTGRGRLITLPRPMSDLFIASDEIADVQVRSPTQLYVFGKKPGETTISATTKAGAVIYAATVRVINNFDSIQQMLGLAMPDAQVTATSMNGMILLTGTVASPADGSEAERLVQAFVGESTKVLSRLRTATPLQVNLQVRFAEVSRNFSKNIGANLQSADSTGGFKFGISRGRGAGSQYSPGGPLGVGVTRGSTGTTVVDQIANGSTFGLAGKLLGVDLLSAIDIGERAGQVSTLANPNLTALSGETGTFLAGGEIPIPSSQGLGAVSVEYKQYGVSLSYTPTVLADGRISLRVRPEVSQLDYSNAVTISGTTVPGLSTRRAETTVELGSGQSFMIAGLLQNNHNNSFEKTPGAGDVPILGALFRSNAFQRNETELMIVITPYLVKPVNANEIVLPTDGYQAPDDASRILFGKLDGSVSGSDRPKPSMAPPASVTPAFGAAAPVLPAPKIDARREEKAPPAPKTNAKKRPDVAPGFSL